MGEAKELHTILVADDDEDDFFLVKEALKESGFKERLLLVPDGEELMNYLHHKGAYADPAQSPIPDLILLDINMPKKSGFDALREIKRDSRLKTIPIVILATSEEDKERLAGCQAEECTFVAKPNSFDELVSIFKANIRDWLPSR